MTEGTVTDTEAEPMRDVTPVASEAELRTRAQEAIAHNPDIDGIILFGSRARGTAHPRSDWDVAIVSWSRPRLQLGLNVDMVWIKAAQNEKGWPIGSVEAIALRHGRLLAQSEGVNIEMPGRERAETRDEIDEEILTMVDKASPHARTSLKEATTSNRPSG